MTFMASPEARLLSDPRRATAGVADRRVWNRHRRFKKPGFFVFFWNVLA